MSGMFVAGGWDAFRHPGSKVERADAVAPRIVEAVGLSVDTETLVRLNGAVMVVGGVMFGAGVLPRLSATALAATLVPTTLAGHRFWDLPHGPDRTLQRIQFLKNASMLGGLLLAAGETRFHPVWSAGRRWAGVRRQARRARRSSR